MLNLIKKIVQGVKNVLSSISRSVAETVEDALQSRLVRFFIAVLILAIPGVGMYVAFSVFLSLFWNFTVAIMIAAATLAFSVIISVSTFIWGDYYPRTLLCLNMVSRMASSIVVLLVTMPLVLPVSIAAGSFGVAATLLRILV